MLSLKGTIVTVDALKTCQRGIAQQIVDQGSDYVLALKCNPARCTMMSFAISTTTPARLSRPSLSPRAITAASKPTLATVSTDVKWLQDDHRWPDRHRQSGPHGQDPDKNHH
jgi:hypothetical protein